MAISWPGGLSICPKKTIVILIRQLGQIGSIPAGSKSSSAAPATYYVSTGGSDSFDGLSEAKPFAPIAKGENGVGVAKFILRKPSSGLPGEGDRQRIVFGETE
jgi:hypothetical protein